MVENFVRPVVLVDVIVFVADRAVGTVEQEFADYVEQVDVLCNLWYGDQKHHDGYNIQCYLLVDVYSGYED